MENHYWRPLESYSQDLFQFFYINFPKNSLKGRFWICFYDAAGKWLTATHLYSIESQGTFCTVWNTPHHVLEFTLVRAPVYGPGCKSG